MIKKKREKEKKKRNITFHNSNDKKYLGVTLAKEVKVLLNKKFNSLKKEIEEDKRKWKGSHALGYVGST